MNFIKRLFTWWNGQSIGTQLFTWRKGQLVGGDAEGNRFYETNDGARRWVIFNGEIEASRISPDWHGWLHHTFADRPGPTALEHKVWEKPHQPNLTGTDLAYAPSGSLRSEKPASRSDYEAWRPE